MQVLFQEQGPVLQQRLDHPHQVDEDGEVVLHDVDPHALGDEGAQSGQHGVEAGVARQGRQGLLALALVRTEQKKGYPTARALDITQKL